MGRVPAGSDHPAAQARGALPATAPPPPRARRRGRGRRPCGGRPALGRPTCRVAPGSGPRLCPARPAPHREQAARREDRPRPRGGVVPSGRAPRYLHDIAASPAARGMGSARHCSRTRRRTTPPTRHRPHRAPARQPTTVRALIRGRGQFPRSWEASTVMVRGRPDNPARHGTRAAAAALPSTPRKSACRRSGGNKERSDDDKRGARGLGNREAGSGSTGQRSAPDRGCYPAPTVLQPVQNLPAHQGIR